jgi:hypothetical protein
MTRLSRFENNDEIKVEWERVEPRSRTTVLRGMSLRLRRAMKGIKLGEESKTLGIVGFIPSASRHWAASTWLRTIRITARKSSTPIFLFYPFAVNGV